MNVLTPRALARQIVRMCGHYGSHIADMLSPGGYGYALMPVRVKNDDVISAHRRVNEGAYRTARRFHRGAP
jgi:hypothetical protein